MRGIQRRPSRAHGETRGVSFMAAEKIAAGMRRPHKAPFGAVQTASGPGNPEAGLAVPVTLRVDPDGRVPKALP